MLQPGARAEFVHLTDDGMSEDDSDLAISLGRFIQQSKTSAHAKRLLAYMEHASGAGLESLSAKQCHEVNKEKKIYEFVSGNLRLLFFKAHSGKFVICSHVFVKKTPKTPLNEVNQAYRLKINFENAVNSDTLKRG